MKVLVTAATKHGATAEIAAMIGEVLRAEQCLDATVVPPEEVAAIDGYDAVVLGSAVYAGHWLTPAKELVDRAADWQQSGPERPIQRPVGRCRRPASLALSRGRPGLTRPSRVRPAPVGRAGSRSRRPGAPSTSVVRTHAGPATRPQKLGGDGGPP